MESNSFSSAMKSNPTVNNSQVNLSRPNGGFNSTQQNLHAPLQMCMSEYDGDIAAKSSVYSETESSLVSAENNAMYHENESRRKREDKEMKL